ncbi:MAG: protein-glutamine gamma-glutamyltransferase, partial [Oscillospiraceae bacterium]|nr:protein-glutamine gamma-glutamyltransferase [Oscillospiraceae bacterium]
MIYINGSAVDFQMISRRYPQRGIEYSCASALSGSDTAYRYGSIDELDFELAARHAIVDRAERLRRCGLSFQTFRSAVCNDRYWVRRADGGFEVRRGASPSAAIRDIYENGRMYGTECATAMQLVY